MIGNVRPKSLFIALIALPPVLGALDTAGTALLSQITHSLGKTCWHS